MMINEIISKIRKNDKKQLLENFLSLGIIQVVSYIIPLVSLPYLSRVLGVENFGRVFFAYAFVQYFIILTDFGFGLSAVKDIAQHSDDKEKRDEIFNAVNCAKILLLIISFIILVFIVVIVPKFRQDYLIYFFTFFMVIGNALFPSWFFQGMQHMKYITFVNISAKIIFLVLLFVFIKSSNQYVFVPLINSMGFLVSAILGIFIAKKRFNVNLYIPSRSVIFEQIKNSFEFFLSRVSASIFTNTNAFFLGTISAPLFVGYYVAAEKIYVAIDSLFSQVNNVLYPYMTKNKNIRFFISVLFFSSVVILFISLLFVFFSENIISIFYGEKMLFASKILKIFAIVLVLKIPATMIGYPLLAAYGKTKETNYSVVISSVVHIIGLFMLFFISKISVVTIAFMVGFSVLTMLLVRVFFIIKYNSQIFNLKEK